MGDPELEPCWYDLAFELLGAGQFGNAHDKMSKTLTVCFSSFGPVGVYPGTQTLAGHMGSESSRRGTGWNRTPRNAHLSEGAKTRLA